MDNEAGGRKRLERRHCGFRPDVKTRKEKLLEVVIEQKRCYSHQLPQHLFVDPPSEPHMDKYDLAPFVRSGTQVGGRPTPGLQPQVEPRHAWFILLQVRGCCCPPLRKMFAKTEFTRRGDVWLSVCLSVSTRRGAYFNVRDDLFARSGKRASVCVQ